MATEGIRVVSRERLVVDCADHLNYACGFEELANAVNGLKHLNTDDVLRLLRERGEGFLYLKVGYLLEKYYPKKVDPSFYKECLSRGSKKKYYFGTKPSLGIYIKRWGLYVPNLIEDILLQDLER